MKENITKTRFKGATEWRKVKSMSEEEIVRNANDDSDASLLTDAELSGFKRLTPTDVIDVKKYVQTYI